MIFDFLKRKKETAVQGAKFQVGDFIYFYRRGERTRGYISKVYYGNDREILYEVQVGGQCPYYWPDLKEEDIHPETVG